MDATITARTLIDEATGGDTLVIHMDDRSTDFLTAIYADKSGCVKMPDRYTGDELYDAIERHSRVFMLGHGGPSGLFARNLSIGADFGPILAEKKDGLYIWCNADAYAHRHGLTGLVSGMFISEVGEAAMNGIRATQAQVDASNAAFSRVVRAQMDGGHPLETVRQNYTSPTCQITKFNSERLYIFKRGVPTPALHPSSLGHPPKPMKFDLDMDRQRLFRNAFGDEEAGERRPFNWWE
jgi:hypothetical protein